MSGVTESCSGRWLLWVTYLFQYFLLNIIFFSPWFSGAAPYPGVPPERLLPLLGAGYRMNKPRHCSNQLWVSSVSIFSIQCLSEILFHCNLYSLSENSSIKPMEKVSQRWCHWILLVRNRVGREYFWELIKHVVDIQDSKWDLKRRIVSRGNILEIQGGSSRERLLYYRINDWIFLVSSVLFKCDVSCVSLASG